MIVTLCAGLGQVCVPICAAEVGKQTDSTDTKGDAPTYYLTQRLSVETGDGIQGVPVGTKVRVIGKVKNGLKIKLPAGAELVATPNQLTQDQSRAQELADQEQAQSAIIAMQNRARAEVAAAAEAARREEQLAAARKYLHNAESVAPAVPATPPPSGLIGSALDEKPKIVATIRPPEKKKKM